jgi:putative SOS response-associated peptidase YedK
MCGRYELVNGERVFIRFRVTNKTPPILDNVDVRPSQQVAVLTTDHELSLMKWGLVPSWAKDEKVGFSTFNARAEGIEQKASFKRPLRSQRVIIPASAFFEWQGEKGHKTKYRIARKDGDLFGFAGLYDVWTSPSGEALTSCTIITTTANREMQPIHVRMPVILLPDDEDDWLDPDMTEVEEIKSYLRPYPDDLLAAVPA